MHDRSSRAEILKENVFPRTQSSSASDPCMVLRGGAIPASLQTFPGMEHDRILFNGMSQDTTSNGLSGILEDPSSFDDEREIEAAAAASEAQMIAQSPYAASAIIVTSPTPPAPPVVIPSVTTLMPSNQTLSPLHISIGESPKCGETNPVSNGSKGSDTPSNGFQIHKKPFHPPPLRNVRDYPSRPSTSGVPAIAPVIMGPPTNSNAPVLLSPAGNLHNGFHRMSSGDSAPSSPIFGSRSLPKGSQYTHPSKGPLPPSKLTNTNNPLPPGPVSNRSASSTTSPLNGRKEHEMTRRRALVDRIAKSRGPEYVHFLPQVEGLTTTQTSILLRKHRGSLSIYGMPVSMQQLIDCGPETNKIEDEFVKKIKEANQKRIKYNEFEDLTDMSDVEEDFDSYSSGERRKAKDAPRWAPKRMRYSGMLARTDTLLAEKTALMGMLKEQKTVMDASCGVRFKNEEEIVRRRRQLNGTYYLYRKTPFLRARADPFGCSRAMPIQSWSKRKPHSDVFEDAKDERAPTSSTAVLKPSVNPGEKWVATAQYNIVSYLTEKKETRETVEYDYEEFKVGEGMQQVNELSSFDPLEFVTPSDFTPFEDRQMEYMYRLSTAPSCTIRKKHGRAIFFETDDRKNASERNDEPKKKTGKKKERKRVEDASSDEDTWTTSKTQSKKRSRGRPAATPGRKKTSRSNVFVKPELIGYMDYLFEDPMTEEFNPASLPPALTYANIHVPEWNKISDDFWDDVQEPAAGEVFEDLIVSVAKGHHHIMHTEKSRMKRETEKRNRNKQSALKSAASTPSQNNSESKDVVPPFDMHLFDPHYDPSRRRFPSVVQPFAPRDFLKTPPAEPS